MAYEKVDPLAVLPVLNRIVLRELTETGAQHCQIAAHSLKMRKLAAGSEYASEVGRFIAELRETTAAASGCNSSLTAPACPDQPRSSVTVQDERQLINYQSAVRAIARHARRPGGTARTRSSSVTQ